MIDTGTTMILDKEKHPDTQLQILNDISNGRTENHQDTTKNHRDRNTKTTRKLDNLEHVIRFRHDPEKRKTQTETAPAAYDFDSTTTTTKES